MEVSHQFSFWKKKASRFRLLDIHSIMGSNNINIRLSVSSTVTVQLVYRAMRVCKAAWRKAAWHCHYRQFDHHIKNHCTSGIYQPVKTGAALCCFKKTQVHKAVTRGIVACLSPGQVSSRPGKNNKVSIAPEVSLATSDASSRSYVGLVVLARP